MITVGYRRDRAHRSLRGSSDPGPVQLSQRKLRGSVFVQLVGDGITGPRGVCTWTSASRSRRCSVDPAKR